MPLLNYQLFICFRKFFGFGQFPDFESLRFPQFDLFFHVKYHFTATVADMNMNWAVLVAVKEKPVSVFLKNRWPGWFVSVSEKQAFANVRADETRATGDQKVHGQTLTTRGQAVECWTVQLLTRPNKSCHPTAQTSQSETEHLETERFGYSLEIQEKENPCYNWYE